MALQWMILTYAVGVEAAIALLLTLAAPKHSPGFFDCSHSPAGAVCGPLFWIPAARFNLCSPLSISDIYWKMEHRLSCTSDICTAAERDRSEKSLYKAQRNVILCSAACILHWCIYRICKYYKDIQSLEEVEKRLKEE